MAHFRSRPYGTTGLIPKIRRVDYKILGAILRDTRERAGLTQNEVCLQLGVPQSFVSKYEAGERRLDVLEFRRICAALKADMFALLAKAESTLRGAD
jgi:transcriptional regulator with XRE-family HTH domain